MSNCGECFELKNQILKLTAEVVESKSLLNLNRELRRSAEKNHMRLSDVAKKLEREKSHFKTALELIVEDNFPDSPVDIAKRALEI